MSPCRTAIFAVCSLLLLSLSACDDPSGVGLDVGPRGFQGGTPATVVLEPTTFEVTTVDDVTGNSARVLTGTVDDPAFGTTETLGYLDVSPPSELPDGFEDATVEKAELVLVPTYVYGNTAQTQQIEVSSMNEWEASGRTADESLSPGPHITTSTAFEPGDTVTVDLPDGWVAAQSLSDTTDFDADFHGFQLRTTGGNAVVGYESGGSYLRVITDQDTASYSGARSFTTIDRLEEGGATPPAERLLVQDGIGQALSFSFTLPDSLQNALINRAELRLPTDTSLFDADAMPSSFVRPQVNDLGLEGFLGEDRAFVIGDSLNAEGVFTFSATPPNSQLNVSMSQIFQQMTLEQTTIDRYRVVLSQENNTISPLLFYVPGTGANAPRVLLTITQSDD